MSSAPRTIRKQPWGHRPDRQAHRRKVRAIFILLVAYYILTFGVFGRWQSQNWYPVFGDEPHYLIMTSGIVHDHTFELTRPYEAEFDHPEIAPYSLAPPGSVPSSANAQILVGPHGRFSIHNIGLPILMVPGFWIGGDTGAKVSLILLSGVIVIVVAWTALGRINSRPRALLTAAAICFALPFVTAASQVYPDIPAGIISLVVLAACAARNKRRHLATDVGLALLLAIQPWLQVKYALPAVIGAAALGYTLWRTGQVRRLYLFLGILGISYLLLAGFNDYAYGHILGPYTSSDSLKPGTTAVMVFFGLHVDRLQGIFLQQPLLAVGAFEMVRSAARRQRWALLATALYLSFVVPNAMHPNWYGGGSFAGRFVWSGAVILTYPTVIGMAKLWKLAPRWAAVLVTGSILLQIWFLTQYVGSRFDFYNQASSEWLRDYPSLYGPVARFLPALYSRAWAFRYGPNLTAMLLLVVLVAVALGLTLRLSSRGLITSVLVLGGLGVVLYATGRTPPTPRLVFPGGQLPGITGSVVGTARVASAPGDPAGYLTYGPGDLALVPRTYHFSLYYRATVPTDPTAGTWDVVVESNPNGANTVTLAQGTLKETGSARGILSKEFTVPATAGRGFVQIRTVWQGVGTIAVYKLVVAQGSPH